MKIFLGSQQYDLPSSFALEMERLNPFFNKIGEKSLAVTLPLTANNKRIIGYHTLSDRTKPKIILEARIEDGTNIFTARQVIHSISSAGISTTFYIGVGCFWSKINEQKIRDLLSENNYTSSSLLQDLMRARDWEAAYDFVVFPVAFKLSGDAYFIANGVTTANGVMTFDNAAARQITDGDNKINVPDRYGIMAFLKAHKVLSLVFAKLGYTLNSSFLSEAPFNQMVFLNTVVDIACASSLKYSQMMPDLTVQKFLDVFRKRFNIEFIPDEAHKTIMIVKFDEALTAVATDLSKYTDGEATFSFKESFGRIILKQTSNTDESKTEVKTFTKCAEKYPALAAVNETQFSNEQYISTHKCVFRTADNSFYTIEYDNTGNTLVKTKSGAANFNIDTEETDIKGESIELEDEAVAIIGGQGSGGMGLMPFVGDGAHYNTAIKDSTEEDKTDVPTMLCFAKKFSYNGFVWSYGSVNEYDNSGIKDLNYSLNLWGICGIFNKFYKNRDAILRHSNYTLSVKMLLPENLKGALSEVNICTIDNQEMLPDSIAYTIGKQISKECKFRSRRLYEPVEDNSSESVADATDEVLYGWVYHDDVDELMGDADPAYHSIAYTHLADPTELPTEDQYNACINSGTIYHETYVDGEMLDYDAQGNLTGSSSVSVHVWWTVAIK